MPLLSFKHLPLRGALIHVVRIDWLAQTAWIECCRAEEGRFARTTLAFTGVRSIIASLESRDEITRCHEIDGVYRLQSAHSDLLTLNADAYKVM